jgi:dihydroxyacetone kinase
VSEQQLPGSVLGRGLEALAAHEDEFRRLDAAAGDGDLGITVRSSCEAAQEWLRAHPDAAASSVLAGLAEVCANTNPSTFSSLVSRGLAAGAKSLEGSGDGGIASAVTALEAGIAMIQRRGGAAPGEKTFLDALVPALAAMRDATSLAETPPLMLRAAVRGTQQTMGELAQHGRAAWVGERARGVPDAGCVVVIRFLEALAGRGTVPWTVVIPEDGAG